jgi:SAM-dependent methyltransferase
MDGHILEGALHCSNDNCLREYPIVDGIPLLVSNIRQYVSDNILPIYSRRDLSGFVETMLGDCCGPNSAFDQTRQHLSSYAWDHYGGLDPEEKGTEPRPGSMLRTLEIACEEARQKCPLAPAGPVLDAGCSVGRGAFALADRNELILGVDLNFAMLRLAADVLRHGRVSYPRRRVGLVYERREFPAQFANSDNVDFWACDAAALPFAAGSFSLVVGMNILDCVSAPHELLVSVGRVLKAGGQAILTCPYDWSLAATPLEAWLGGHSQRSPLAGSPEAVLRTLLTPGAHLGSINTLRLVAEREALPWHVRLHDRSVMSYKVHLAVATRPKEP